MSRISPAQLRALAWLAQHGGHARLDRYGNAIARDDAKSGSAATTWLRLMISGHVARSFLPAHLGITEVGLKSIEKSAA